MAEVILNLNREVENSKKDKVEVLSQNRKITELKEKIFDLERDKAISKKTLADKDTLIDVIHRRSRSKKRKIKEKCEDLFNSTVSLQSELKDMKKAALENEEEMKNELNEMEKQLHRAILQSEQLEKRLFSMVDEKSILLEKVSNDAAQKAKVKIFLYIFTFCIASAIEMKSNVGCVMKI